MFSWRNRKIQGQLEDDEYYICRMDVGKTLTFRNKNKKLDQLDESDDEYLIIMEYGWSFGE